MNAIEMREVSLALGGRSILTDISLDIAMGEFVGVLGPNGSGKTTLMRAILGLVPPGRGSIHVLGYPATRGNPAIGYMPQVRHLATDLRLSGRDFVASTFNGHRFGLPLQGRSARTDIDHALELVGASGLARRPLGEISGGERQRLLLAQALIGKPHLLLLDEPLISLDPHHQQEVVDLVKSLQTHLGITVLFSAHDVNSLLGAIDQVLYLGSGLAAIGAIDDVITGPVLSRLYGSRIDVLRVDGRIFVMSGSCRAEADEHRHESASAGRGQRHSGHA
ncbi:MAG: metal ABC transporter ATP-binding protein [Acidiferrobacterales bacterium]